MKTRLRNVIAALALTVAVVPAVAGPADAASKHRRAKAAKRAVVAKVASPKKSVAQPAPAPTSAAPAATPAPAVTSVISIGGYVFYNLTYAEAVEAYAAAVAAAPPGYTPPPVTSISVDTAVGGTVG
jgi:hypothetical protein